MDRGQRIAKLLTLLRAESRFSAVGTCALKRAMSTDPAEVGQCPAPHSRHDRVSGRIGGNWRPSIHNGQGRQMAVFNGVRRSRGRVHNAEEISPLRVSVLRIAVRQAHTSNALIPGCPALS